MIALVSAPSNLGLRPPAPTTVPGCAKAPGALREAGLFARFAELGARDAGVVLPGRYADDASPGRLRNQDLIVEHARRLAARITGIRAAGDVPLVVGGDCSLLVAAGLALRTAGRFGLAHLDGHTDFRHPGNSSAMPAVDSPDPGGIDAAHLTDLLTVLAPRAAGAQITVFDPDLDPDGRHARLLVQILAEGLGELGAGLARHR